ncbi:hypothetical protein NDU88_000981 [Pleurodeles waltl]|uniref:Uncharacterized protein n=1 Tax=Pleurodeles waltl TaxID=8319 RepID=A0AAV7WJ47_PLEWA|nr:hypothetical protein NDU88_000981 [Pleurodeles waltl]
MQFPARLRVITPTGVQFFLASLEVWSWTECQPGPGPSGEQHAGKRKCRARSWRRGGSVLRGSPTAEEVQPEKLKADKEVASVSVKETWKAGTATAKRQHKFSLGQ